MSNEVMVKDGSMGVDKIDVGLGDLIVMDKDVYVVSRTDIHEYNLVSLSNGNRWTEPSSSILGILAELEDQSEELDLDVKVIVESSIEVRGKQLDLVSRKEEF